MDTWHQMLLTTRNGQLRSSTNYNRCRPQSGKFGNCKDPCRRPGYLYVPAEEERYRETRWMPFTSKFLNSEDPETAAYLHTRGDHIFNDTDVPRTFFKGSNIPIEWMKLAGPNARPDLILWQNGLWDQRRFQVGGQKLHEGQNVTLNGGYRKLVWDELHFFLARTKKYAEMIIGEFPDIPMMWRSLTYHQKTGSGGIVVIEMDSLGRALAEQYGHGVFVWGRIISLMGHWYEDGTHPGEGALSWLQGNMILEYLARSAKSKLGGDYRFPYFDGWERCHGELVGWGGR
ncbi:hypothetical protein FOIG_11153 [Fusarium odoratissimum NRRL 54006]|uniref:Uncharacterized protein n=2 Tax=Fusarium oxysporum species complex TaxID=171631 RepID=X0KIX7_FUSO5|nr:uncharacterized protein FOIG_11153 [Fusarium odoratissimum NRRL 54006]EXL96794.1 hypothetical protein FOIG_11153 [Fusarium odoratissimum NRRL 54006]TXC03372.1 hypothetical protein FocTR4_00000168 [Fusarium oxysporum f. sp. cubense]